LEKLARALSSFHPLLRAIPDQVPFRLDLSALRSGMNFTLTTDVGDVDILSEVTGIASYLQVEAFSEVMEIFGINCKVLTLEGLIKAKHALGRAQDLRILPELEACSQRYAKGKRKTDSRCCPFLLTPINTSLQNHFDRRTLIFKSCALILPFIGMGSVNPNPTLFRSGSGDEPYSRGQWDTALRATPQSPGVVIRVIDACEQPARSGAHGFRSHRPRSLLTCVSFVGLGLSLKQMPSTNTRPLHPD
jgi:hypothetical protein